ncbi:hypothetical protein F5880DRAFT_1556501 [Lentinula raphanica]|nr:hypothetical protein F5880DRAFT_1556501 [Lentinula raphanica]
MFRLLAKQPLRTFSSSSKTYNQLRSQSNDFRPPWVYTFARVASNLSICVVMTYAVFFYDFGNDDHVFQPVRRWVSRQKSALLSLSPDEERFIESEKRKVDSKELPKSGS